MAWSLCPPAKEAIKKIKARVGMWYPFCDSSEPLLGVKRKDQEKWIRWTRQDGKKALLGIAMRLKYVVHIRREVKVEDNGNTNG